MCLMCVLGLMIIIICVASQSIKEYISLYLDFFRVFSKYIRLINVNDEWLLSDLSSQIDLLW